jgi:hypothetical protein
MLRFELDVVAGGDLFSAMAGSGCAMVVSK